MLVAGAIDGQAHRAFEARLRERLERVRVVVWNIDQLRQIHRAEMFAHVLPVYLYTVVLVPRDDSGALPFRGLGVRVPVRTQAAVKCFHGAVAVRRQVPVDRHGLDVIQPHPRLLQAKLDGMHRVAARRVLLPDEPFLLGEGKYFAAADHSRRGVHVIVVDPQEDGAVRGVGSSVDHASANASFASFTSWIRASCWVRRNPSRNSFSLRTGSVCSTPHQKG